MSSTRIRITAGVVVKEVGFAGDEIVRQTVDTDFSAPDPTVLAAAGKYGSYKVTDDGYPDRSILIGLEAGGFPPPLTAATNMVSGRTPITATAPGSADVNLTFTADTSGGIPSTSWAAIVVLTPVSRTVVLEVLRGASVVASSATVSTRAGAWTRLTITTASLTGSGSLTIRARVQGALAGEVLSACRPMVGTPTDGYFDGYTFGCAWTGTAGSSASTRPGTITGEAWSAAVAADIEAVAGALASVNGGTVDRYDSAGALRTYDAISGTPDFKRDQNYYLGQFQGNLKMTARGLSRGAPIPVITSIPAATNGVIKWASSSVVPGDVPALLDLSAVWGTVDREAVVGTGPCTVWTGAGFAASAGTAWSTGAISGGWSGSQRKGWVPPASAEPVASVVWTTTEQAWKTATLTVRAAMYGLSSASSMGTTSTVGEWVLTVDGAPVQRIQVPVPTFQDAALFNPWRLLDFGPVPTNAKVEIACHYTYTASAIPAPPNDVFGVIDYGIAQRADGVSARLQAEAPYVGDAVTREDFFAGASGGLGGRTVDHGGQTWTASNMAVTNGGSTVGYALATSSAASASLPTSASVRRAKATLIIAPGSAGVDMNLTTGGTNPASIKIAVSRVGTAQPTATVRITKAGAALSAAGADAAVPFGVGLSISADAEIAIDPAGRWTASIVFGGITVARWAGHATTLDSSHTFGLSFAITSAGGSPYCGIAAVRTSDVVAPTLSAINGVARPITSVAALYGSRLTCKQGEIAQGVVLSADTDLDAPSDPQPSSMSATITPRYL